MDARLPVHAHKNVRNGPGVATPLQHTGALGQRNDLVGTHLQRLLPRLLVLRQQLVHEPEDLLHDGVLSEVVLALYQLIAGQSITAQTDGLFGRIDPTHQPIGWLKAYNAHIAGIISIRSDRKGVCGWRYVRPIANFDKGRAAGYQHSSRHGILLGRLQVGHLDHGHAHQLVLLHNFGQLPLAF